MNGREIALAVQNGEISQEEAMQLWRENQASNTGEVVPVQSRGIEHAPLSVPTLQVQDREALAEVRRDLALVVESTSTQHEYQRQMVEERFRHYTAMPIIALLGIADGALEGIGYSISEIAESFSYAVVRTGRRIKEGVERGARQ